MIEALVLAGCGKMGGAMLEGWLDQGLNPGAVHVVEPVAEMADALHRGHGVNAVAGISELPADLVPDVVVFAVKPQVMSSVAPDYARFDNPRTVFLSIAAGKPISYFEDTLGAGSAVVRSMPNTPAAVRQGITVACPNTHVTAQQRQLCETLLTAIGAVEWIDDEGLIDAITALSGGGPAYVFLLVECLAEAGVAAGLPRDLSERLARVTVSGSGELLRQSIEEPATLRKNVTSPGGTTAEALKVLMADDGWQLLVTRAIAAATDRSRELAG